MTKLRKSTPYLEATHKLKEAIQNTFVYKHKGSLPGAPRNMIIACTDKRFYAGGMCDRFKGMVSAYAWAKANGYEFRISHSFPYELHDFIDVAEYDWTLKPGEMSPYAADARMLYARGERTGRRLTGYRKDGRQIHYFGNMDVVPQINQAFGTNYNWGELFRELFKPGKALQEEIDRITPDTPYISVSYRFQHLLGDFDEKLAKKINDTSEREKYISSCIAALKEIMAMNPGKKVLVASDSGTFVDEASKIEGVFVVPGERVHIQFDTDAKADAYLKTFLDFYLLSGAEKLYRVCAGRMYGTQFPLCASRINNRELIDFRAEL